MRAEQLLQHFERISEAPDAIPRLRRFILDLAVRGKLVEQEPADEPAAELLKRIAAEKARMLKEGALRSRLKENNDLAITESEKYLALPGSWSWIRLMELGYTQTGTSPSSANSDLFGNEIPFIKPGDLDGDEIIYDGPGLSLEGIKHSRLAASNTVLMVCIGATLGKVNTTNRPICFNQQINSVTPVKCVESMYLALALKCPEFQKLAWSKAGTGTLPIISKGKWEVLPIPLPPLAEQHRIVAKADELMSLCDQLEAARAEREKCRDSLVAASLQGLNQPAVEEETFREHASFTFNNLPRITTRATHIKQLRQTILNLAVRGKLAEQEPSEDTVSMRYQNELGGEDIPETWRVLNFGKYCNIEGGNQPPKSMFIDKPRNGYIRLFQIRDLGDRPVPVYIPVVSARSLCKEGEILIGRYGASVGKIFWAKNGAYNVAMAKFIWPGDAFIPRFAFFLLKSDYLQGPLNAATRSAQAGFNKSDLAPINFPLPPLAEQHRIVAKVDELMAICDQLEAQITVMEQDSRHFLESVLADALAPGGNPSFGRECELAIKERSSGS